MKGLQKPLSLDRLAELVEKLEPQQITRLPLLRLPTDLPDDWIAGFAPATAEALRVLRRRLRDPQARTDEIERIRNRLRSAVRWLRRRDSMLDWLEAFEADLAATEQRFLTWREGKEHFVSSGAWPSSESLESDITMSSPTNVDFPSLERDCRDLVERLAAHDPSILRYTGLMKALQKQNGGLVNPAVVARTLRDAHDTLNRLQDLVSRLRILRLYVVHHQMLGYRERIEKAVDRRMRLARNRQQLALDLRRGDGWLGRLRGRDRAAPASGPLREMIDSLERQMRRCTVQIPDQALDAWIDVLVEVSVDSRCRSLARSRLDAARGLFVSLIKYKRREALAGHASPSALSLPTPPQDPTPGISLREEITQELQQSMQRSFASLRPDALLEFRAQQGLFYARLQQLQNQLVSEFLAPTSPRHMISA